MLYYSLTGLVSSTLGTFAIFPVSVAKLESLLSLPGKLVWALERGLCPVAGPCSSVPRACGTAPLLLPPHEA